MPQSPHFCVELPSHQVDLVLGVLRSGSCGDIGLDAVRFQLPKQLDVVMLHVLQAGEGVLQGALQLLLHLKAGTRLDEGGIGIVEAAVGQALELLGLLAELLDMRLEDDDLVFRIGTAFAVPSRSRAGRVVGHLLLRFLELRLDALELLAKKQDSLAVDAFRQQLLPRCLKLLREPATLPLQLRIIGGHLGNLREALVVAVGCSRLLKRVQLLLDLVLGLPKGGRVGLQSGHRRSALL
mmetsp:Transcript_1653/g.7216  ORF Transcript_1653/g.7216 Transcript_1653/m.7216 type:complete len:238 (-) Transcript_1653:502-1215(-)